MKILFVCQQLTIGGAERDLVELLKGMDKERFNPTVVCLERGGCFVEAVEKLGVQLTYIERRKRWDFGLIFRLARYMRYVKADIVQSNLFLPNFYALPASILARVPKRVLMQQGLEYGPLSVKGLTDRLFHLFSTVVVTNSFQLKGYLLRTGYFSRKVFVIHNGCDEERFKVNRSCEEICATYRLDAKQKKVGVVARLHPMKDHWTFFRMAEQVLKTNQNVQFVVVGDGTLRGELEAFVEGLGIKGSTIFTGPVSNPSDLMSTFDILCSSSSRTESLSNSLIEALFMGIPVVATKIGGVSEIVQDGHNGLLVPVGDYQEMAKRVELLLRDGDLAESMGSAGREIAKECFSLRRMVADYESIWSAC